MDLLIVVCTRDRPHRLQATVAALRAQHDQDFEMLVIDQGAGEPVTDVAEVLRLPEPGLSRARNAAWRSSTRAWIAFVDDDCALAGDWTRELRAAIARHPEAGLVSGAITAGGTEHQPSDYVPASILTVEAEELVRGAGAPPYYLGVGTCFAVRREWVDHLGGWDERLGAGTAAFPACEDMDFNWRFLRAGGVGLRTPRMTSRHEQWRSADALVALQMTYSRGWGGWLAKVHRTCGGRAALQLAAGVALDSAKLLGSAARRRSFLRLRFVIARARGLAVGFARGQRVRW